MESFEVTNIVGKSGDRYKVAWKTGEESYVSVDNLDCFQLVLDFEIKKNAQYSRKSSVPHPNVIDVFDGGAVVKWTEKEVEVVKIPETVTSHFKKSKEQLVVNNLQSMSVAPSKCSLEELHVICPMLYAFFQLPEIDKLPLMSLPNKLPITFDDSVMDILQDTTKQITHNHEDSRTYLLILTILYCFRKLGTNKYKIVPQNNVVKTYREDYAIFTIQNSYERLVSFIELALNVNEDLAGVDPFKVTELLLYTFYQYSKWPEMVPITSVLTDSFNWHIFQLCISQDKTHLKLQGYVKLSIDQHGIMSDAESRKDYVSCVSQFCQLILK